MNEYGGTDRRLSPARQRVHGCLAAVALLVVLPTLHAAHLESDLNRTDPATTTQPPPRIRPPSRRPGESVRALIRRIDVGRPTSVHGLSVFPLLLRAHPRHSDIRTLDEAINAGWLDLHEKDRAQVAEILVRNTSRHTVLLMAGEILAGGKQNRMVQQDVLLVPGGGLVPVPVYCGEKERWSGGPRAFGTTGGLANDSLRKMATAKAEQGAVWREIDRQLDHARVAAPTRSYQQLYDDPNAKRAIDECITRFRPLCRPETVGAVLVDGDRIVSADLFSDPALCSRLWDKICRSYAVNAVGVPRKHLDRWPNKERDRWVPGDQDVRQFLEGVLDARIFDERTPGAGQAWRISGAVTGSALEWEDVPVHVLLFPSTVRHATPVGHDEDRINE